MIGQDGAVWHPSPNFGPRRDGLTPELIVLHYTAMASAVGARDWLCTPEAQVSAHYVLDRDGTLWQLVSEDMRAWHAGQGAWQGHDDVNSRSIGIEIVNTGTEPFPEPQMARLEGLIAGLLDRWSLGPMDVIGHSDCAPARKIDPGRHFDWQRLARAGLSIWPDGPGQIRHDAGSFLHNAGQFGYDVTQNAPDLVLSAFRLRFRPWATGPCNDKDAHLMHELAQRWGGPGLSQDRDQSSA